MENRRFTLFTFLVLVVFVASCLSAHAEMIIGSASSTIGTFTLSSTTPALIDTGGEIYRGSSWASAYTSDLGGSNYGSTYSGSTAATVSTAYGIANVDPVQASYSLNSYEFTANTDTASLYAEAGMDIPPQNDATSGAHAGAGYNVTSARVTQPTILTLSIPYILSVSETPTSEGIDVYDYFLNHLVQSYVTLSLHATQVSGSYNYWTTVIMTANQDGVTAQYTGNGSWPDLTGYNIINTVSGDTISGVLTLTAPITERGAIDYSASTGAEVRYTATPIPAAIWLLGSGLLGLLGIRRRFKK